MSDYLIDTIKICYSPRYSGITQRASYNSKRLLVGTSDLLSFPTDEIFNTDWRLL